MKRPLIRWVEGVIGVLLLLLLYVAFRDLSPASVWAVLKRTDPWQVLGLLLLNGGIALLLANRWWIILRGLDHPLGYLRIAEFRLIGATVSLLTPGPHFGGEPAQIHLLVQDGVPLPKAIASVTLEKTLELIVNFGFLVLGAWFVLSQKQFGLLLSWTAPLLTISLLLIPAALLFLLWRGAYPVSRTVNAISRVLPPHWQMVLRLRLIDAIQHAEGEIFRMIHGRPLTLMAALAVSLLNWLILMGEYWLATEILRMDLSFAEMMALLVAARLAFLLPMPGGLGTLEAGQVFTLLLLGHDPAAGVGLSLLMRIRDLTMIAVGVYLAWRSGWLRRPRVQPSDVEIGD